MYASLPVLLVTVRLPMYSLLPMNQMDFTITSCMRLHSKERIGPCPLWLVSKHRMTLQPLDQPIGIGNIDGTSNHTGAITHFIVLDVIIDGHVAPTTFLVAGIGRII
jgi:hypothetical protein